MSGFPDEFVSDEALKRAIGIIEITQLERTERRFRLLKQSPIEALRTVSFERPCMTERALMALEAYGRLGLTIRELYEKRKIWLYFPDDGPEWNVSARAVSMLLRRLNHRLADRKKEGREWRYWINNGGRNRLAYYRTVREIARSKSRGEQPVNPTFNQLNPILEENRKTCDKLVGRYKENLPALESSSEPTAQISFKTYMNMSKLIPVAATVLYTAQAALATGDTSLRDMAFSKCTKCLTRLKEVQELLLDDAHVDKG